MRPYQPIGHTRQADKILGSAVGPVGSFNLLPRITGLADLLDLRLSSVNKMSGCAAHVILLCWSLLVCFGVTRTCFICCQCGDVSPDDPLVFVNETLVINCTLTSPNDDSNSSTLYFIHEHTPVNQSYHEVVDNGTLTFRKVAELTDAGNYYCHRRDISGVMGLVGGQQLEVDYEPQEVTELQCIWYNWKDGLKCSWELPAYNMRNIEVQLQWYNGVTGQCPNMSVDMTSCTFDPSGVSLDTSEWYFKVNVTNTRRKVSAIGPYITKIPAENAKPNKVDRFGYKYTNDSSCVQLTWIYDVFISRSRKKQFRVRYWSSALQHEELVHDDGDGGLMVCDLDPDTLYTYTVDVRAVKSPFYSDPFTISVKTDQDVPLTAPVLRKGAYHRTSVSCLLDQNGYHDVTIYWKKIQRKQARGDIVRYTVKFSEAKTANENEINVTAYHTEVYFPGTSLSGILRLKCNATYVITLQAATEKGLSKTWSYLRIPFFTRQGTSPSTVRVEEAGGDYKVTWAGSQAVGLTGYTVYYCQRKNKTHCKRELVSVDVDKLDEGQTTLVVQDKEAEYLFGVSSDFGQFGSGFDLVSCVYHKNAVPPPPSGIVVSSQDPARAMVTWNHVTCSENAPIIVSYTIRWYKVNEELNKDEKPYKGQNTSIPANQSALFLMNDVQSDGMYCVQICSSSSVQPGPFSDTVYVTLAKKDIKIVVKKFSNLNPSIPGSSERFPGRCIKFAEDLNYINFIYKL
ncbi:Protogenin [Mizuhopecten yessoensis]|uniref:Protogenin n=1 Tax=Mizuhopecten yessoensis TaxID=6573 RepID=A0A210PV58_MIZYE|nr:Protogenin [Mizuhopecten yessoensis]